MRSQSAAFLLLFSVACGGSDPDPPIEVVGTPLAGVVFLSSPSAGAAVEVRDFLEGGAGEIVGTAVTDEDGRWSVDLGALSGTFLVTARTPEGVLLTAVAEEVSVGEGSTIVLSPVTRLATAYAHHLRAIGFAVDEARLKARRLFHLHFGRIDHHRISPQGVVGASDQVSMLTPPVLGGILLGGLEMLLEEYAAGSIGAVLDTLANDVESDGVFDGRAGGETVSFAVDGQTLRLRYADALRRFLAGPRNATMFRAEDVAEVLREIEVSRSELFPNGLLESDMVGPTVSEFELVGEGGVDVDPSRGVRGRVRLRVAFEDPIGVSSVRLEDAGGSDLVDIAPEPQFFEATIETTSVADGAQALMMIASDSAGNETRMELVLLVDNTPPTLSLDEVGIGSSATLTITGSASDAISGMDVVEASIFGTPIVAAETRDGAFAIELAITCNAVEDVGILARDRAGNERRESIAVFCDDQAPRIRLVPSMFSQEGGLVLTLDADGTVDYSSASAATITIDEQTPMPVRVEKYFNRFDVQSPNLPVIRFLADDPSAATEELEVGFRYLVDGIERGPYGVLPAPGAGQPFEIPISYQTLGTELATDGPTALHRIEIFAIDAAGNRTLRNVEFQVDLLSPPVWVTACDTAMEVRNHTLAAQNFHTMYGTGVETDVAVGALRYALDLAAGSMAPAGGVVLEPGSMVRTRVVELGEDKFQEPSSHNFVVNSIAELAQYCPFNTPGVYLNQAGVNENTRVRDQVWVCAQGLFPNEQVFSTGVVNDDAPHTSSVVVISAAGIVAPPSGAGYVIPPDAPFTSTVQMHDPVVRFQGANYDWSQDPRGPVGYVAAVANASARYRMAPAAGLHHTGVDRWNVPNGGWAQERFFETRSYIRRVEIEAEPLMMSARHATLAHVQVDVWRDAACAAPVVYTSQL